MICIIIPTYNEKENIFKLIEEITKLIENVNIVVVDDSVDKLDALKKIDSKKKTTFIAKTLNSIERQ